MTEDSDATTVVILGNKYTYTENDDSWIVHGTEEINVMILSAIELAWAGQRNKAAQYNRAFDISLPRVVLAVGTGYLVGLMVEEDTGILENTVVLPKDGDIAAAVAMLEHRINDEVYHATLSAISRLTRREIL